MDWKIYWIFQSLPFIGVSICSNILCHARDGRWAWMAVLNHLCLFSSIAILVVQCELCYNDITLKTNVIKRCMINWHRERGRRYSLLYTKVQVCANSLIAWRSAKPEAFGWDDTLMTIQMKSNKLVGPFLLWFSISRRLFLLSNFWWPYALWKPCFVSSWPDRKCQVVVRRDFFKGSIRVHTMWMDYCS